MRLLILALLLPLAACEEIVDTGAMDAPTAPPDQPEPPPQVEPGPPTVLDGLPPKDPEPEETPAPACQPHPAEQIIGLWQTSYGDDWTYRFTRNGTYRINDGAVTINGKPSGDYAYHADSCTLILDGGLTLTAIWTDPDQFCTAFPVNPALTYAPNCHATFRRIV